ncbi:MAG: hypothetical protein DRH12_06835 [Deltaproteobacteria bacterium]|nr:MAG: hypothetical protein DRH12_06835 [Deltaproteobacteria bacterium]
MQQTPQVQQDTEAATKLKEAEVYYSMGLVDEAKEAYRAILFSGLQLTAEQRALAEKRLGELEGEDKGQEEEEGLELANEVMVTTEGLASEGNIQAILDGAFALRELALYDEAINEYVKLFSLDYPPEKVVPEICKCLLRSSPPAKVKEDVSRIIEEYVAEDHGKAMAKFRLGLEMERLNKLHYAMELYQEAALLDPGDERIKERIEYLSKKHVPKKQKVRQSMARKVREAKERRKWERVNARIPEFVFVEFDISKGSGKPRHFKLRVANYSKYGLGLLVPKDQKELLEMVRPGDKIKDVTFFAKWAVIRVDVLVRHVTELDSGPHKGQHVIGVESDEIIESASGL